MTFLQTEASLLARCVLAAWTLIVATAAGAGAQSNTARGAGLSAFAREKARVMLRDRLSCLGCHRIGSDGGAIGPDLSRAGAARSAERVLVTMRTPRALAPGGFMPPVVMREDDARLVAAYVASLNETPTPLALVAPTPAREGSSDGAKLYARHCASCHGATGNGDGTNAANLPVRPAVHSRSEDMARRTDDRLYDAIAAGGAILGRSPRMPAFGAALRPAEIRSLVEHIRLLCDCKGPAWSRDGQGSRVMP